MSEPSEAQPTKTILLEPSEEHPIPYDLSDEEPKTKLDDLKITASTADLLDELGADDSINLPELDDEKDETALKKLLKQAASGNAKALQSNIGARSAQEFMRNYSSGLAMDHARIRSALTNKLLELADHGDAKIELKAIELLGKHSDIGMFTERSEININYNSPEALEKAIKDRVKRLLNAQLLEGPPLADTVDDLFAGVRERREKNNIPEGDFEEIEAEEAPPADV